MKKLSILVLAGLFSVAANADNNMMNQPAMNDSMAKPMMNETMQMTDMKTADMKPMAEKK